jgi:hypothetical protein
VFAVIAFIIFFLVKSTDLVAMMQITRFTG